MEAMQQRPLRRLVVPCSVLSSLVLAASCGFGTAGVVSSLGSGGGATNAPATPTSLLVVQPKVSPADIRIVLADAEANEAEVEFLFATSATGGVPQRLTRIAQNPVRLATSREGREQRIAWDFANEPGIGTTSLSRGVRLFARIANGVNQDTVVDLGNDAPVVVPEAVSVPEVTGVVPLAVQLSDSSSDISTLKVEYRIVGEAEDAWRLARAGGLAASEPTPAVALTNLEATQAPGLRVLFFWDSAYVGLVGDSRFEPQLPGKEQDVVFRFTAADGVATALPVTTAPFRVDNNARPTAQINDGFVQASSDRHRTIPVPVTVFDEESDRVDVVLQWRRSIDPDFEDLGTTDAATLRNLLEDATYRRDKQIAKIGELTVGGRGELVDARHLRTSVLALDGAWALTQGLAGKELELLRPVNAPPVTVSSGWSTANISQPVAILPIGMGVEAVVLQDTGGSARVDVLDVQTGAVRPLAAGIAGTPTAMCWSARQNTVLVATQATSGWIVYEVVVSGDASVPVVQRAVQPATGGSNVLRGVVARSATSVLATAGDQLLQIDWSEGSTRSVPLMRGMSEPHGLVLDPYDRDTVMIAERTFPGGTGNGRVARWNLRTRTPQAFLAVANVPVRPSAMATDPTGNMLFVLSEPLGGGRVLRRYRTNYSVGAAGQLAYTLPADATCFGVGQTGAWVAASKASGTVVAHGGASHRRTVVAYDPSTMRIELDSDLVGVGPLVEWRIAYAKGKGVRGAPGGRTEVVLWDSIGLTGVSSVALRAIPLDSEIGIAPTASAKFSLADDAMDAQVFAGSSDLVDLDGDGDRDVLAAGATPGEIRIQQSPRSFAAGAAVAVGASSLDWNGDGRNDLVEFGGTTTIRIQGATGAFPISSLAVNSADLMMDLDGDGLLDLVKRENWQVFFQGPVGTFGPPATVIANPLGPAAIGDINGDGLADFVFFSLGFAIVQQVIQVPGRAFLEPEILTLDYPMSGGFISDLDRDGIGDVVAAHPPFQQLSPALFVPAHANVIFRTSSGVREIQRLDRTGLGFLPSGCSDLDGNGLPDLVGAASCYLQVAEERFVDASIAGEPRMLVDVDGDGAADALRSGAIAFRRGAGSIGVQAVALPGRVVGDVDGDALTDVVRVVSGVGTTVSTFLQSPFLVFSSAPNFNFILGGPEGPPVVQNLLADFNRDGLAELVSYSVGNAGALIRFRADGGPASTLIQASFLFGTGRFAVDDYDGDGALDVCCVATTPSLLQRVAFQRGVPGSPSGFAPDAQINMAQSPYAAMPLESMMGDFDGNGLGDVCVSVADGRTFVFMQGTAGAFALPGAVLPTTGGTLRTADVDNDGFTDLLRGSQLFWGSAGGLSTVPVVLSGTAWIGVEDLDGDRLLDLVGAGASIILRQVAPRTFSTIPNGGSTAADELLDVDHDGEMDALGASFVHFGDR
ncbi:MAG: VCBS repeat-containing protein [Planctomycetota bacterium]